MDKNSYIGLRDVERVLTSMGIKASDEEVEEMIRLASTKSTTSNQIAFPEFHSFVFQDLMGFTKTAYDALPKPVAAVPIVAPNNNDATDQKQQQQHQQQQHHQPGQTTTPLRKVKASTPGAMRALMVAKAEARATIENLVRSAIFSAAEIESAYKAGGGEPDRLVDFSTLVKLLKLQARHEGLASGVFQLFLEPGKDKGRLLSYLIAIGSTLPLKIEEKATLTYRLCDIHNKNIIQPSDIQRILLATYMTMDVTEVSRKATLIVTAANGKSGMSLDAFIAVAKRFPNVIYPSFVAKQANK